MSTYIIIEMIKSFQKEKNKNNEETNNKKKKNVQNSFLSHLLNTCGPKSIYLFFGHEIQ